MSAAPPSSVPPIAAAPKRPAAPVAAPTSASTGAAAVDVVRLLRSYWQYLAGAGIFGIALGIGAFFLLAMYAPKFRGVVHFQVDAPPRDAADPGDAMIGLGGDAEMQRMMETQVVVMTSDVILQQALEERDIQSTVWAQQFTQGGVFVKSEALVDIREIVNARVLPETTVISLTVTTSKKADAPLIANAIASVYLKDVERAETSTKRDLKQKHEEQVRKLRGQLDSIDRRVESLLGENQVTSLTQQHSVQAQEVDSLQPALVVTRQTISQAQEQLAQYEQLRASPTGTVYPEVIRAQAEGSPIVQQQNANIATEKARLRSLREVYGDSHREIQRTERVIRALEEEKQALINQQMADIFNTAIESLRNSIASYKASEADLMGRLEKAQVKMTELTTALKRYEDLQLERSEIQGQITLLQAEVTKLDLLTLRGSRVRKISDAQLPDQMAFPQLKMVLALSTLGCVGLVGGLIFLKEMREQRVRGPQDVALIPRTKVLGLVPALSMDLTNPENVETAVREAPQGAIAEAVRQIRTRLMKEVVPQGKKAILVMSGLPGSGSSTVVSNLALNAASAGHRVLIIDGNVRRPALHKIFGLSNSQGLGNVLLGETSIDSAIVSSGSPNLYVLPAGMRDARVYERFGTEAMRRVIEDVKDNYELVLVDAPPGVVSSDALAIAHHCDAAILVVRAYSEKRGLVSRLRDQINDTRVDFLGVIVNAVKPSAGGYFKRNVRATHEYCRVQNEESDASELAKLNGQAQPEGPKSMTIAAESSDDTISLDDDFDLNLSDDDATDIDDRKDA